MPRFSATPQVPPPTSGPVRLRIGPRGDDGIALDLDDLMDVGSVDRRHDLHCVTTWSYRGARWTGVPLVDVWSARVAPRVGAAADHPYVVAVGADRYLAVLRREDLLQPEVLLAWALDGRPIEGRHGGPLRLVSPRQYGYPGRRLRGGGPRDDEGLASAWVVRGSETATQPQSEDHTCTRPSRVP